MKLFTPGRMGSMWLKNRLVIAPLSTNFPSANGEVTPEFTEFYVRRARGGAGLIILESTDVDAPMGKCGYTDLRIDKDMYMPGLFQLVDRLHMAGTKVALQLNHAGGMLGDRDRSDLVPVAASGLIYGKNKKLAREATIDEIHRLQEKFVMAAERAKKVGFDAVEIHGGHGYLIAGFLSPWTNKRTDEYGGSVENRARFAVELVEELRRRVGPRYPILFRISGDEFVKGGRHLEETIRVVELLKAAGVDCIHVTAGTHRIPQLEARRAQVESMKYPQAWKTYLAREIRQRCGITTIAVGTIRDVDVAERVVQEDADFVAMARGWIAEPDWGIKARAGLPVRRCINCNSCILYRSYYAGKLRCCVNAMAGRESFLTEPESLPKAAPERVAVVGGGPAGMEAARVAAIRGRLVTLFEKKDRLGGNLVPAGKIDLKEKIRWITEWEEEQLRTLGVNIVLNTEATADMLAEEGFRRAIVTAGSLPRPLRDIGDFRDARVAEAVDVLNGDAVLPESDERVYVLGSGLTGLETAYFLACTGKKVTVLSRSRKKQDLMSIGDPQNMAELLIGLARKGVLIRDGIRYKGLNRERFSFEEGGVLQEVPYGGIVLAQGLLPNDSLARSLHERGVEVLLAGDCVQPRTILTAVSEGFMAGYTV